MRVREGDAEAGMLIVGASISGKSQPVPRETFRGDEVD
jgi:hypothetical protein